MIILLPVQVFRTDTLYSMFYEPPVPVRTISGFDFLPCLAHRYSIYTVYIVVVVVP